MGNLQIKFIVDTDQYKADQQYVIEFKEAAKYLKAKVAKRVHDAKSCGCKGKETT